MGTDTFSSVEADNAAVEVLARDGAETTRLAVVVVEVVDVAEAVGMARLARVGADFFSATVSATGCSSI